VRRQVRSWNTRLEITPEAIEVLVTDRGREVLHAQFSGDPVHPRALLFLLEGLALCNGKPLCVVISAESPVHPGLGLGREGDDWPGDTPLLEFLHVERPSDGRRPRRRGSR
jgi:hypothetical protein